MASVSLPDPVGDLWPGEMSLVQRRALNAFLREGVRTVGGLVKRTEADLRGIRHFGDGCVTETRRALAANGLALAGEQPPDAPRLSLDEAAELLAADLRSAREPGDTAADLARKLAVLGWVKAGAR